MQMTQAHTKINVPQEYHRPTTNVDGSAMLGGIDVNGKSYGATKSD